MTLIVEDGTVVAGAESYGSLTDAATYHAARNNTAWAAIPTDAMREGYLRQATEYMTGEYRDRWAGSRTTILQALDWPRYMVPVQDVPGGYAAYPAFLSNVIVPIEVKRACFELALRASVASLAPDMGRGVLSEAVGVLKTEYDPYKSEIISFRQVDMLLKPWLRLGGGGAMVRLVRA
jgi:hypothetical protein